MTPLYLATIGAELTAAIAAVLFARRRVEHRPAAVALVLFAAFALLRAALVYAVLRPARAALPDPSAPFSSPGMLAAVYCDGALVLGAVAVTPGLALAVAVSPERRRLAIATVLATWMLASVVLAALYPSPAVRNIELQRLYLAADLIGLAVSTIALVGWARRGIEARRSPGSASIVALGLVGLDLGILLVPHSPWRDGTWVSAFGRFDIIQVGIVVFFAAFAAAQGVAWHFSPR